MKVNVVDKRGKVFGLHPKVAQVLVGKGTVRYAEEPELKRVPSAGSPHTGPTYSTKIEAAEPVAVSESAEVGADVVAITATEETTEEAVEETEISPRTGLPKRQYRRRDMQAE